ncbi:MAG: SH3 domain-containing protein [Clostridia bacterium]|nr:SH3 domain-containing protein [Clostridia bacterium]
MKKILAIFLALIMILSVTLVACQKNKTITSGGSADEEDDLFVSQNSKDTSKDTSKDDKKTGGWEAAAYPIYCMADGLNVRSSASITSEKLGSLKLGEKFDAIERNDDWYKITYGDREAYVSREYVTADANEAKFNNDDTPTALTLATGHEDDTVNLRNVPVVVEGTEGIVYNDKDHKGTLTKIGQNLSGNWYIVEYDADGDGEKAPVTYFLKINSTTKAMFGISSNVGGGYS